MINVKLICTGSLKESYLREAYAEYAKRLGGLCRFETVELKEHKLGDEPSGSEITAALDDEGKKILALLAAAPRAYKIALCVEGKQYSSEELAQLFEKTALSGISHLVFIIGGKGNCRAVYVLCLLDLCDGIAHACGVGEGVNGGLFVFVGSFVNRVTDGIVHDYDTSSIGCVLQIRKLDSKAAGAVDYVFVYLGKIIF